MTSRPSNSANAQQLAKAEIIGQLEQHDFEKPTAGWENSGEYVLMCSACDRPLVHLVLVDPDENIDMTYMADCPCGDGSFKKKIHGRVIYAPVGDLFIDDIKIDKNIEEEHIISDDFGREKVVSSSSPTLTRLVVKCRKTMKN